MTILYDFVRTEEKLLVNEFRKLGVNLRLINIDKLSLRLDSEVSLGVSLVRPVSHLKASLVAKVLNAHGVITINNGLAIENAWNKAVALSILAKSGIPIVPTKLLFSVEFNDDGIQYPVIVKPVHGSWGRLVSLVGDMDELRLVLKHNALDNANPRIYMLQPFIGNGKDYRVFVIGDEVVASMTRLPSDGDWRSNVARGGIPRAVKLSDDAYEYAVKAVKVLGLDYAGVDMLQGPNGYLINEVNAIPEFKGLMIASGVNIARKIAKYVINLVRR
ncbi:MAG: RimK family alpha-L-glutamate ligase [Vulcanisaeta sp. AZ3]